MEGSRKAGYTMDAITAANQDQGKIQPPEARYYCRKCSHAWTAPNGIPDHISCPLCGSYHIGMREAGPRKTRGREKYSMAYNTIGIKRESGR